MEHPRLILSILPVMVLWGCGGAEETAHQVPVPAPVERPVQKKPDFETRTDTVATVRRPTRQQPVATHREPQIRFMVQIGAYRDPEKASTVQTVARQRFHLPVLNDYHTTLGLYQIRLGFFETRTAADQFRRRMVKDHPDDYRDSWVVQLKR